MRGSVILAVVVLVTASAGVAEVPISIAESGHATVPVTVDGVGTFDFVLDTGAEGTAIYRPFFDEHGFVASEEEGELIGQTGSASLPLVAMPPIRFDGVVANAVTAIVFDARSDGVPLPGIVGLDVFGQSTLDFDLPNARAAVLPSGTVPEGFEAVEPVVATPSAGSLLTVPMRVGGVEATAVIDTGARKTRINWQLGRMLGLDRSSLVAGDIIQGGTNNAVETVEARLSDVRFGAIVLDNAPALIADLPVFEIFEVADRPAIIFGMDWLESVRMVIDFPRRLIWFRDEGRQ